VASVGGLVTLVAAAWLRGDAWHIVGCSIFGATLVLLYAASTLYHGIRGPRVKRFFQRLDHAAIFLLIAGTYTPILLGVLSGAWGWTLFGLVWGLALAGIIPKSTSGVKDHAVALAIYVAMGCVVLIAVKPLFAAMPTKGIIWLVAGGLFYTGGILFYRNERMPYAHAIWHLFVIAGTVCHFIAIIGYAF